MDRDALRPTLQDGIAALNLAVPEPAVERLLDYIALLARWNQTYNLTAIRDPHDMVAKHLLDSLAAVPYLDAPAVADLGTGAGLPGIPLALARPATQVSLVESNGKKARFLREAVRTLPLPNAEVVEARAEDARAARQVPLVTARALAALADLCLYAEPWLGAGGKLVAMKGPGHEAELAGLPSGWSCETVHRLAVPGLDGDRVLVVLRKAPE